VSTTAQSADAERASWTITRTVPPGGPLQRCHSGRVVHTGARTPLRPAAGFGRRSVTRTGDDRAAVRDCRSTSEPRGYRKRIIAHIAIAAAAVACSPAATPTPSVEPLPTQAPASSESPSVSQPAESPAASPSAS
jgi:hypothetical protein